MQGVHPSASNDTEASPNSTGPLAGVRVLEIESIGPGPFAAMLLADLGANILRVSRPDSAERRIANPVLERGRAGTVQVDMKSASGHARILQLVTRADVLLEGFRPGVMERLRLGPEECLAANPQLIYGRVTGWGRSGEMAKSAGHDINYIARSGALYACGGAEGGPIPPLNLVGDFGGGGLVLALGIVSALFEGRASGRGQVVDATMVDGAATLMAMIYGLRATGRWPAARAGNLLDGSAYYYRCYRCACGGWMAVGAIELDFRRQFLTKLGLEQELPALMKAADDDPHTHTRIADLFQAQSRAYWEHVFGVGDHCVSAVLSLEEVAHNAQKKESPGFHWIDGAVQPVPVPNFSRTPLMQPDEAARAAASRLADWEV